MDTNSMNLINAGSQLANIAYNLAQRAGQPLASAEADLLQAACTKWHEARCAPAAPGALTDAQIDYIGEQWDGCIYDAGSSGNIDIGEAIRIELKKLQPAAPAQVQDEHVDDDFKSMSSWEQSIFLRGVNRGRAAPSIQALPVVAEPTAPAILEAMSYHARERDDLTLEDAVKAFRFGYKEVRQRDDRAMLAQIIHLLAEAPAAATPAAPVSQPAAHPVVDMLLDIAHAAHDLMDSTEESGPRGRTKLTVQPDDFSALSDAMEKLAALPDDQPGVVMGPAAKAAWAMNKAAPAPLSAPAGSEQEGKVMMPRELTRDMKAVIKEVAPRYNAESVYANLIDAAQQEQSK